MNAPDPFAYPPQSHVRKHAPAGYKDYADYKPWLRDEFEFRCVYCLHREMWSRDRHASFSVDHMVPQTEDATLICVYSNLAYACLRCNWFKQAERLLDPTQEGMGSHLRVEPDGTVTGLTEDGQFLIEMLHLNASAAIDDRRHLIRLLKLRQRYPHDKNLEADFLAAFRYPEDLPDLRPLKPPEGNRLDANKFRCFHVRRETRQLPDIY